MYKVTHEDFIRRVNEVLPDITVMGEYVTMHLPILVKDEHEFEYKPAAGSLVRGYKPTFKTAVDPTAIFIYRSRKIHGNRYDYSKTKYINFWTKLIITCKKHGDFNQSIKHHYIGSGCPVCNGTRPREIKDPFRPKGSSVLYMVALKGEGEFFYKAGITTKSVTERFRKTPPTPYKIVDIYYIYGDALDIYNAEQKIHKIFKRYKYIPQIHFSGYSECFTWYGAKIILTLMNDRKFITSPIAR